MNKQFDLNHQWKLFCDRAGIPEERMPEDQRREMKRAFFGACGQMLILLRDDLAAIPDEDKAAGILQDMLNQVANYWMAEAKTQN